MKLFNKTLPDKRKAVISLFSITLVPMAFIFNGAAIDNKPLAVKKEITQQIPEVTVTKVIAKKQYLSIKGYAQAQPKYQMDLTSQVKGNLISLNDDFQVGSVLEKNALIAQVDPTNYEQLISEAEYLVAQAKVKLLEEERKIKITKRDRRNITQAYTVDSPLVYGEPQLKSARAGLKSAKSQLKTATKNLSNTKITVPFESIMIKRFVAPGQYVNEGDKLATIYSAQELEFHLSLPLKQWQILFESNTRIGGIVTTISDSLGNTWRGELARMEQHINPEDRQRTVVFKVGAPLLQTPKLLAGVFAEINIEFSIEQNLLALPAHSLSPNGDIWYVDEQSRLARFNGSVQFQHEGFVYVLPPKQLPAEKTNNTKALLASQLAILNNPSPKYFVGQVVKAHLTKV